MKEEKKDETQKRIEKAITEGDKKIEKKDKSGVNKPKKKVKKSCVTKRMVELGQFEIRVSEAKVDIETKAKNWKISYTEGTTPYFVICSLIVHKSLNSLKTLILALYSTSIFFVDANTVMAFIKIVNDFKGSGAKPLSEEEDQAVLEEEKLALNTKDETEDEGADNIKLQKTKEAKIKKSKTKSKDTIASAENTEINRPCCDEPTAGKCKCNEIKKEDKEDDTLS